MQATAIKTKNERVFDLLCDGNLNWQVDKIQLPAPQVDFYDHTGEVYERPKAHGIYVGKQYLATVGDGYTVAQNSELAEIFITALDNVGLECETRAGHLCGKRKIYMQAALPDRIVGPDKLNRYLSVLNSHDGSSAAAFGSSSTVVMCQNTFYKAFAGMPKVNHTKSVLDNIRKTAEGINKAMAAELGLMRSFDIMAQEMLTKQTVGGLIDELFGVGIDDDMTELSTRKQNQIKAFAKAVKQETSQDRNQKTIWGLFNAVTWYTNHEARPKKYGQMEYVMERTGADLNKKAYNHLAKQLVTGLN